MGDSSLYDEDILIWSEQQAAALRSLASRRDLPNELDLANVIEEIEDVGRSEFHTVESLIENYPDHLVLPGRRSRRARDAGLDRGGHGIGTDAPTADQSVDARPDWIWSRCGATRWRSRRAKLAGWNEDKAAGVARLAELPAPLPRLTSRPLHLTSSCAAARIRIL